MNRLSSAALLPEDPSVGVVNGTPPVGLRIAPGAKGADAGRTGLAICISRGLDSLEVDTTLRVEPGDPIDVVIVVGGRVEWDRATVWGVGRALGPHAARLLPDTRGRHVTRVELRLDHDEAS